ncbi:MAG: UvrD-helicase domain-containing protein [Pseudomonadales bacterium]
MIVDSVAREKAIDPQRSFTVTAPAGSGKTELLTQRYLSLLAVVKQPESILAITFTRKAVAEMRARIVAALEEAGSFEARSIELPEHRLKTIRLAQAALKADQEYKWGLLENPARMRVYTFDAFSASLVRQMPLASRFGGNASPGEHPEQFYQKAIERVLAHLGSDTEHGKAIKKLLLHMNVRVPHVANLLTQLLAKRDQWRGLFASMHGNSDHAVGVLHQWFCEQVEFSLRNARELLLSHEHELCNLMNFANTQLRELGSDPLLAENEEIMNVVPKASVAELATWRAIEQFLLTKQGSFRATVNIKQGFPPKKNKPQYTVDDFKALVLAIGEDKSAAAVFAELAILPDPDDIKRHKPVLRSLMEVLHVAMAYLEIEFQQHQQVDFVATSLQALEALADNSDLAMKLDYSIQHILVDEFQDTSQLQYDLLDRLCQEWSELDEPGRSLFLVGDAMQSIYSFRNARVALFMHARQYGLAGVRCENLELQSNFRSSEPIIIFLNHCFARIFPAIDDLRHNASAYVSAVCTVSSSDNTSEVQAYEFALDQDSPRQIEAGHIATKIRQLQELHPSDSVAILVRNRTHARHMLPALRALGIDVTFTDFERLIDQPIVMDLLSLTRLLLNPADQIAWYAFLRSPLLDIPLADLLKISQLSRYDVRKSIALALAENDAISEMTEQRLRLFLLLYDAVVKQRNRKSLVSEVVGLWTHLGGGLVYADKQSGLAYKKYLSELLVLCSAVKQPSWENIDEHMAQLRVNSETQAGAEAGIRPVELMTMHKAKGLEFDSVILPALDLGVKSEGAELLTWTEQFVSPTESTLLLGLPENSKQHTPTMYDYVREQNRTQSAHEAARLLYVACSRARKRLYLYRGYDSARPEHNTATSLAALLWPNLSVAVNGLDDSSIVKSATPNVASEVLHTQQRVLPNLAQLEQLQVDKNVIDTSVQKQFAKGENTVDWTTSFESENTVERCVGVVVHRNLQQWINDGTDVYWRTTENERRIVLQTQLRSSGLGKTLNDAVDWVEKALRAAKSDHVNQWLFEGGLAEVELRVSDEQVLRSIVIDRQVEDADGNEWIVDYKTHLNESASKEDLEERALTYLPQLRMYQQAFTTQRRLAVYFVLQQTLIELS